eukprot:TRINITY_DN22014_c0_g2_i2.p1 TRINITY_DN22014_c0_g2~~TRINITY_DN22014_c0_g2_i2.p1  ORF type:complete len:415 (-),score=43.52 TRINITY_DN22014_c0_g2_i2:219-1463(-)
MWYNPGPHLQRRMLSESGMLSGTTRSSCSFFVAESATEEFKMVLIQKFGTLTRAWRVGLDDDQGGTLSFREFANALKELGYTGNIRTLWFNLDDDYSGSISLKEIDPQAAHALEKFRVRCTETFGTMENMFHTLMDQDHSGTVALPEFVEAATELGYSEPDEVEYLFECLRVRPGCRFLTYHDLEFLQCWEDNKKAKAARSRLRTGWVNKDPFLRGGNVTESLMQSISMSDQQSNYSNQIGNDPEAEKQDFLDFLTTRYGSLSAAFDLMDANASGGLSLVEFQTVVVSVLRYCRSGDANRLFFAFCNGNANAQLTWEDLGVSRLEWTNYNLHKRNQKLKAQRDAFVNARAPLGKSIRMKKAERNHVFRLREQQPAGKFAFASPMPEGWGFPQDNFVPREPSKHLRLPAMPNTAR